MPIIMWTPDLAVGVEKIDDQHKQLFKAADDLAEAIFAGRGHGELEKTIDFLAEYTVFHFRDEEQTMIENGYPGYAAQKSSHERFEAEIGELKRKYKSGEVTGGLAVEVLTKACTWFKEHIRTLDRGLGGYLKEKTKA